MYVLAQVDSRGNRNLVNLVTVGGVTLEASRQFIQGGTVVFYSSTDANSLNARFDDICAAVEAGDVTIYDCNKEVGYWKPATPKRAPAKKAPPKKEAP